MQSRTCMTDAAQFTETYRQHSLIIYRFALHMSGSEAIADEVTQDTFMVLIHHPRSFDPARGTIGAFLYGVARNLVRRHLEQGRKFLCVDDADEEEYATEEDLLGDLTRRESLQALQDAVLCLPPKYRETVVLCDLQEMSYEAAASSSRLRCRNHSFAPPSSAGATGEQDAREVRGMTCAEYRKGWQSDAVAHAWECPACARYLDNQNRIRQGLRSLAESETRGPSPAVQAALLREWKPATRERPWKTAALAGALAAGVACLFLLRPEKEEPKPSEHAPLAASVIPPVSRAAEKLPPKAPGRRVRPAVAKQPEIAQSEFVQVPFSEPLDARERSQLLRVSMPVTTLVSWGFPVAAGEPDRVIDADVVVGEDGLARAVRLVR